MGPRLIIIRGTDIERLLDEEIVEQRDSDHRGHYGASMANAPCDRANWFTFFWCVTREFPARILRLFRRGEKEEDQITADLRSIGIRVWDVDPKTGKQIRISFVGGHGGGSLDAMLRDVPGIDGKVIGEYKTHNLRSMNDLEKHGVQKSKPQHYGQMQMYMHGKKAKYALYYAVCKNDDRVYTEIVEYDAGIANSLLERAEMIITSDAPPAGVSKSATWFECKMCDHLELCHGQATPDMNCRTCMHSEPQIDGYGTWHCERHGFAIDVDQQRAGCEQHLFRPALLKNWAEIVRVEKDAAHYRHLTNDADFVNGPEGYRSAEIAAASHAESIAHPTTELIKGEFPGAEIVG